MTAQASPTYIIQDIGPRGMRCLVMILNGNLEARNGRTQELGSRYDFQRHSVIRAAGRAIESLQQQGASGAVVLEAAFLRRGDGGRNCCQAFRSQSGGFPSSKVLLCIFPHLHTLPAFWDLTIHGARVHQEEFQESTPTHLKACSYAPKDCNPKLHPAVKNVLTQAAQCIQIRCMF